MGRAWRTALLVTAIAACRGGAEPSPDASEADARSSGDDAAMSDAAPDDAPTDAPTDAATDAPTDAAVDAAGPLASPRVDTTFGLRCDESQQASIYPMKVQRDGTVLSKVSTGLITVNAFFQACHPDGAVVRGSHGGSTMWSAHLLSDERLIGRYTNALVVRPDMSLHGTLVGAAPFADAYDAGGIIYAVPFTGAPRYYDATTLAPLASAPGGARKPLAYCAETATLPATVLVAGGAGIVRVDPTTWNELASYTSVPLVATDQLLVEDDCSAVVISTDGAGRVVRGFAPDGTPRNTFAMPIAGEIALHVDHHRGLIASFPSTMAIDLRLARIDLDAGGLDPAFGDAGFADLAVPGVDPYDDATGYNHVALRSVGADADGNLAILVERSAYLAQANAHTSGADYARVLVDH
jgi:hypothetical protein